MEEKKLFVDLKDVPDDLDISKLTKEVLLQKGISFTEVDLSPDKYIEDRIREENKD